MMKKKKPLLVGLSLTIISLLVALYFFQRKDVEVSKISSDCKENACKVIFVLTNKTNYYITCKVSIRAHKRTPGSKSSGVVTPGFSGERILDFELHPKEKKEINEGLLLTGSKSRISVIAYNIKKQL
jgi:hypothetical protein